MYPVSFENAFFSLRFERVFPPHVAFSNRFIIYSCSANTKLFKNPLDDGCAGNVSQLFIWSRWRQCFRKVPFSLSTRCQSVRAQKSCVFKKFHFGKRFRNVAFSMAFLSFLCGEKSHLQKNVAFRKNSIKPPFWRSHFLISSPPPPLY